MSSNLCKINTTTTGQKKPKVSKMSSTKKKQVVYDLDKVWTTEDVKRLNALAGWHFYSPSTSRCFKSRPVGDVYGETAIVRGKLKTVRVHFVDSSMSPMGRTYTPCYLTEDGEIERHRGRWLGTWRDSEVPADIVRFPTAAQARGWIERWINTREYTVYWFPEGAEAMDGTCWIRVTPAGVSVFDSSRILPAETCADFVFKDLRDLIKSFSTSRKWGVNNKNYKFKRLKLTNYKEVVLVSEVKTGCPVIRLESK